MTSAIDPVAREFIVTVNGDIAYRTDSLKRARGYRRIAKMFHPHSRVSIVGYHRMMP